MRVLIISNRLSGGGAEGVAALQVEQLKTLERISEVFFCSSSEGSELCLKDVSKNHIASLFSVTNFFRVFLFLFKKDLDVVHVHNYMPSLSPSIILALYLVKKIKKFSVVQTFHDFHGVCPNSSFYNDNLATRCVECSGGMKFRILKNRCYKSNLVGSLYKYFRYQLFSTCFRARCVVDCFIAPSEFMKENLMRDGFDIKKVFLLPNCISDCQKTELFSNRDFKKGILYIGRLSAEKNVEGLLQAVALLRESDPDYTLHICGVGPQEEYLKKLSEISILKGAVYFHGYCNKKQLSDIAKKCSVLVLPSIVFENAPLVLWESIYLGVLPTCSNFGGMAEFAKKVTVVETFDPDNYKDIAIAIKLSYTKLKEEGVLKILDENAKKHQSQFSKDVINNSLVNIYEKIVGTDT